MGWTVYLQFNAVILHNNRIKFSNNQLTKIENIRYIRVFVHIVVKITLDWCFKLHTRIYLFIVPYILLINL